MLPPKIKKAYAEVNPPDNESQDRFLLAGCLVCMMVGAAAMCGTIFMPDLTFKLLLAVVPVGLGLLVFGFFFIFGVTLFYASLIQDSVWMFLISLIVHLAIYPVVLLIVTGTNLPSNLDQVTPATFKLTDQIYLAIIAISHLIGILAFGLEMPKTIQAIKKTPPLIRKELILKSYIPQVIKAVVKVAVFVAVVYYFLQSIDIAKALVGGIVVTLIVIVVLVIFFWLLQIDD